MPDDSLPEVRQAGGQFYGSLNIYNMINNYALFPSLFTECPRGHPYFVSEVSYIIHVSFCLIL